MKIKRYTVDNQKEWDDFIKKSENGTFLHLRDYMDYHQDRFQDYSLMIYDDEKPVALFPAHKNNRQIFSHNGLTYGDFIFPKNFRTEYKLQVINESFKYLKNNWVDKVHIKTVPEIFKQYPNQINTYLYEIIGGKIEKILPFFVLDNQSFHPNSDRKKNIKKAQKLDFTVQQNPELIDEFWKIVDENLQTKYQSRPVHSLDEIKLLMKRFPNEIELITAIKDNKIISGALCFKINHTFHFQYIHSVNDKELRGGVDSLVFRIIRYYLEKYQFISLGSAEKSNGLLNKNLTYWKESFGAYAVNQYFYTFDLSITDLNPKILI